MLHPNGQMAPRRADAVLATCGALALALLAWGLAVGSVMPCIVAGVVAANVIVIAGSVNLTPDDTRSQATERTLRVATNTLEHLRGGLTPENAQAELTARAEVKALQAQINPHFLFNTLNTIASLCRTDPMRARSLLRDFSMFYRHTLESSESGLIPLSQELEQTRRYLTIEKARFGEDRIVESEHVSEGIGKLRVPSFVIQPLTLYPSFPK